MSEYTLNEREQRLKKANENLATTQKIIDSLRNNHPMGVPDMYVNRIKWAHEGILKLNLEKTDLLEARKKLCYIAKDFAEKYYNEYRSNVPIKFLEQILPIFSDDEDMEKILTRTKSTLEMRKLQGCYIATCVYGSYDCPQVWTLRRFRDDKLKSTCFGRLFIRIYYFISPKIIKIFGNSEWFKSIWKRILDPFVNQLQIKGTSCAPYDDKI